jgi:hypothetical protein
MFDKSLVLLNLQLSYHKKKAKNHFAILSLISIVIFVVVLLNAGYVLQLLKSIVDAQIYLNNSASNIAGSAINQSPDLVALVNENYFVYAAISGFVVLMITLVGLLRFHIKRVSQLELDLKRTSFLNDLSGNSGLDSKALQSMYENMLSSELPESPKIESISLIKESFDKLESTIKDLINRKS